MNSNYLQYRATDILCHICPRRFAYWIGLRVADVFFHRDVRGRSCVISNLRRIFAFQGIQASEETLYRASRQTFRYFGKYLVDFFRFSRFSTSWVRRMVSIEHGEYVREAIAADRGVLVVTAHLGSWEIGAGAMAALGHSLNAVVLPERHQKTDRLFQRRRSSRGVKVIPLGHAAGGILRALRRGEWVALMADRDYSGHHDMVPFFGAQARLPTGPARLCVKTGAPVLPAFLLRQEDDTYLLRWDRPIFPDRGMRVEYVRERICRVLERAIWEHPTQWFIFEDFWNHRAQSSGSIEWTAP